MSTLLRRIPSAIVSRTRDVFFLEDRAGVAYGRGHVLSRLDGHRVATKQSKRLTGRSRKRKRAAIRTLCSRKSWTARVIEDALRGRLKDGAATRVWAGLPVWIRRLEYPVISILSRAEHRFMQAWWEEYLEDIAGKPAKATPASNFATRTRCLTKRRR